jgi:hypothetical protein
MTRDLADTVKGQWQERLEATVKPSPAYLRCAEYIDPVSRPAGKKFRKWVNEADGGEK